MEEKKISTREEVESRIAARLEEISNAQTGESLPKGTAIEDEIVAQELAINPPVEKTANVLPGSEQAVKKAGRPRGSKPGASRGKYKTKKVVKEKKTDGTHTETTTEAEHDAPEVEKIDFIAQMANNFLLPMAAHFLKKEVEHLKITDEQSKQTVKYMPEDIEIKPSWSAYIGMSLVFMAGNIMAAPKRSAETAEMAELKKALQKSIEVEHLRKDILDLQKKNEDLFNSISKMNVTHHAGEGSIIGKSWTEEIRLPAMQMGIDN